MYKFYIHGKIFGGIPENVSFMQFSQNIDGFRQNDSQGFLELMQLYITNHIKEIFHFHYLPKLYKVALNSLREFQYLD